MSLAQKSHLFSMKKHHFVRPPHSTGPTPLQFHTCPSAYVRNESKEEKKDSPERVHPSRARGGRHHARRRANQVQNGAVGRHIPAFRRVERKPYSRPVLPQLPESIAVEHKIHHL